MVSETVSVSYHSDATLWLKDEKFLLVVITCLREEEQWEKLLSWVSVLPPGGAQGGQVRGVAALPSSSSGTPGWNKGLLKRHF